MRISCKPRLDSIPTFVALHPEGEVYVPLGHAYLYQKCEDCEQAR